MNQTDTFAWFTLMEWGMLALGLALGVLAATLWFIWLDS